MADFITKEQLTKAAKKDRSLESVKLKGLIERFTMSLEGRAKYETSIFLSHSHKDKELVYFIFSIFKDLKVNFYIDWLDDSLAYPPSNITANKIKKMIKENRKFILLATNDSIISKWCNWELGLGDADKYINHIALFPVADNSGEWLGNEYLQIYPYIDKTYKPLRYDNSYNVIYPDGKKVDFVKWLKS
tara:strand:+ start:73 stop:639 length:567 start_codon:yes stop_codon:yes gene_type:complete